MTTSRPSIADDEIAAVVVRLIRAQGEIELPDIGTQTRLARLPGFDSLRRLEVVALAEEHFKVEVDTDRLETIVTVGDIVDAVSTALQAASG